MGWSWIESGIVLLTTTTDNITAPVQDRRRDTVKEVRDLLQPFNKGKCIS